METRQKIRTALQRAFGGGEAFSIGFDTSSSDQITALVTSNAFQGRRDFERHRMIWDALDDELDAEERAEIVLLMANTPEETAGLPPREGR